MRGYFVYYLKILLAISAFYEIAGNLSTASSLANAAYRKLLQLRSLPFEDCGSKYQVLYLNIESCSTVPCTMSRDSVVKVTVLFDDNGNGVSFLKHEVRWVFSFIRTQAVINPDPCDGDHYCLLNVNDGKTFWSTIYVNTSLPLMRGNMLWEAKDENNLNLICFEVPVQIVA